VTPATLEKAVAMPGSTKRVSASSGAGGLWFLGFLGAIVYYLHFHSGTFWLVVLAFLKALFWPAYVVYHVLTLKP
jgi:hypothetical protein